MSYKRYFLQSVSSDATPEQFFLCDAETDLSTVTGFNQGDRAYCLSEQTRWVRNAAAWANEAVSGGGIAWREFCLLADSAGVTMTNIGTAFVQVGANSLRDKVDLTGFANCRVVVGANKVGTGTQDWKIQYSTDGSTFTDDLTGAVSDAGAAGEKLLVGSFAAIPAAAQADVWIRLVGKSTIAGDDPVVKSCKLHVK